MGISLDHCVVLPHTDINVTQRDKGADCRVLVMSWANHFPTAEECTLHRPSGPARLRVHRECETRISVHRAQHDVNRIKMDECVAVVFQNQRARVFLKLSELFLASAYFLSNLRSEEHTYELQSHSDLVCRLLLEKKKKKQIISRSLT